MPDATLTLPPEGTDEVLFPDPKAVVGADPLLKSTPKKRQYTHIICDTTHEMSEEDYSDMMNNPDRWNNLSCGKCGAAGFRIGEDGEMVWAGSKDKVVPGKMPA